MCGRFRLSEIPLEIYVKDSKADDPPTIFRNILRYLYHNAVVTPPANFKTNSRNPELTVDALNYLLDPDRFTSTVIEAITDQYGNTANQIQAIIRQLQKITNLLPILLIKFNESTQNYDEIPSKDSFYSVLDSVQQKGTVLILDVSTFKGTMAYAVYVELVDSKIQYLREKLLNKILDETQGDLRSFQTKVPLLLKINEEATMLFSTMDKRSLEVHLREATGARKFNMGTLYVFQNVDNVDNIILSQLGGFNIILGMTMETNVAKTIKAVHISGISSLEDYIMNSKRFKNSLCSCEAYAQRPFFVHFYKAEDYISQVLGKKVAAKCATERQYDHLEKLNEGKPKIVELEMPKTDPNKKKEKNFLDE
jgi:hypothetical protein